MKQLSSLEKILVEEVQRGTPGYLALYRVFCSGAFRYFDVDDERMRRRLVSACENFEIAAHVLDGLYHEFTQDHVADSRLIACEDSDP